jgi:hypothetical protein
MRQRTINWAGAMRDMKRHRTPEQMLASETLATLKDADKALGLLGMGTADDLRRRLYDLIRKLEARAHV